MSSNGRFDTKVSRLPSGLNAGSQSFHCPENGATVGLAHFPLIFFEKTIVCPSAIYTVLPSGVNVETDSLFGAATPSCVKISGFEPGLTIFWQKAARPGLQAMI